MAATITGAGSTLVAPIEAEWANAYGAKIGNTLIENGEAVLRRIWLVVAAMAVGLLAVGATQAMAANSKSKTKAGKRSTCRASCRSAR